jgi:CrcB protein
VPEPTADLTVAASTAAASPPPRSRLMLPRADRREVAAIFAGGALGTLARAALAEGFPHAATAWPWPTFAVNVVAAFLLGYFVTRLQERLPLSSYRRPLLGTGLCGGLSTFSTMQVEILKMLSAHAWALAAGYTAASVIAGYAALLAGTSIARRVRVRARAGARR